MLLLLQVWSDGSMRRYLLVRWPALGSNDLNLDQLGTSIQILPEPKAGHVTRFLYKMTLVERNLDGQNIVTGATEQFEMD